MAKNEGEMTKEESGMTLGGELLKERLPWLTNGRHLFLVGIVLNKILKPTPIIHISLGGYLDDTIGDGGEQFKIVGGEH